MPPTKAQTSSTATATSSKVAKMTKLPKSNTTSTPAPIPSTSTSTLPLPASFSQPQATKAVTALLSHAVKAAKEREETELIPKEEYIWLNMGLKTGSVKKKVMPVRIQLPHPPLPPPPATSICLITKDPQREYKDLLAAQDIKFVSRVVGIDKLKGKFKPYEARRALMKDHELFLADERVMGLMPGLLGKIFYEAKKLPISVNLKHKDLKKELARAVASTYLIGSTGTSISIRIATLNTSTHAQTLDNLLAAIPQAVAQQKGGWDNILSLGIKTSNSVLLPVWSAPLDGRFDLPASVAGPVQTDEEKKEKKEKRKSVFDLYAEEEQAEERRAALARGEEVDEEVAKKKKGSKRSKTQKKEGMEVDQEEESAAELEQEEKADMAVKAKSADKGVKAGKKVGKKSSTIGSGGAGKKAKEAVLGKK